VTMLHGCRARQAVDVIPPDGYLIDTDIVRASEPQHPVQGSRSDGNLGRLGLICARAKRIADHALVAAKSTPRPWPANCSRWLSARPCGRVRRSSADGGRAGSERFQSKHSLPHLPAAVLSALAPTSIAGSMKDKFFSSGLQHAQNRCGAAKEVEPAVVGGDLLIGS